MWRGRVSKWSPTRGIDFPLAARQANLPETGGFLAGVPFNSDDARWFQFVITNEDPLFPF